MKCMACNGLGWYLLRSTGPNGERIETDEDCPECDDGESDD